MKISRILTAEAGPLGTEQLQFCDDWTDETSSKILISGPNGCGKSTLLESIAAVWSALGHWIERRQATPATTSKKRETWRGFGLQLEDLPNFEGRLILAIGEPGWLVEMREQFSADCVIGESRLAVNRDDGDSARVLIWPDDLRRKEWLDQWTRERQKMVTSSGSTWSPNMIFLDAEERRWVPARENIGEIRQEDLGQRWLARYLATNRWESQLEAGLISMKIAIPERFQILIDDMNGFLQGKQILTDVSLGENRLWVELSSNRRHLLDQLSAGERQVLILLYQIGRWLEPGGIALIDEPDLHIHPSLVPGLLGQLEKMVADRRGQLFVTSHAPEVWQRYEAIGQRVLLEAKPR